MIKITITDEEGNTYPGFIPQSWADVSLKHYAALAMATGPEERRPAMAAITGLPLEAFEADEDLLPSLLLNASFLYKGPLPDGEPAASIEHHGTTYNHVGDLATISAYQHQIALDSLPNDMSEPQRMAAIAPLLLAMIYTPAGNYIEKWEKLAGAPEAMESLPMSIGWPALMHLVREISPRAVAAQTYHLVRGQAEHLVATVEQQLLSSPPKGRVQKAAHALARKALGKAKEVIGSNYTPPKKKRKHGKSR